VPPGHYAKPPHPRPTLEKNSLACNRWHAGTLARWHAGTLARWHAGTLARWHAGVTDLA